MTAKLNHQIRTVKCIKQKFFKIQRCEDGNKTISLNMCPFEFNESKGKEFKFYKKDVNLHVHNY